MQTPPAILSAPALTARLQGASQPLLARRLGMSVPSISRALSRSHAASDDISCADPGRPPRIRHCITCSAPIVSWHAGIRMCMDCRSDAADLRWLG